MRMFWSVAILTVAAGCSQPAGPASQGTAVPAAQAADTIYTGGDIVTVNDKQPAAEAVAVKDGKILAVGARADLEVLKAPAAPKLSAVESGKRDGHRHQGDACDVARILASAVSVQLTGGAQ